METTTLILIIAACAIIFIIYLRFFKKEKDTILPHQDPRKDEYYELPADENTFEFEDENKEQDILVEEITGNIAEKEIEEANKEYDIPEKEISRIIPDEEIEQYADEHEKELIRINNYFISNGIKNLIGDNFFNIQENILLDASDEADLYSDIHQIFQISENRYIAITDLPDTKKQMNDQENKRPKALLGIIECRTNLGNGRLELIGSYVEEEVYEYDANIKIGRYQLHYHGHFDNEAIESLCNETDKIQTDHVGFIIGSSVYIRINQPARLDDLKTIIEALTNFQF